VIAYSLDPANKLTDWRCSHCHQLLARQGLAAGHVEIKCRKCGTVNSLSMKEGNCGRGKSPI
jgi:phage FluMu protein Com